jgi:hypothetical protein
VINKLYQRFLHRARKAPTWQYYIGYRHEREYDNSTCHEKYFVGEVVISPAFRTLVDERHQKMLAERVRHKLKEKRKDLY